MRIIYDDLNEFAEVVIRCNDTVRKGKCQYCPFFDRCDVCDKENRHIMCGKIENHIEALEYLSSRIDVLPLSISERSEQ